MKEPFKNSILALVVFACAILSRNLLFAWRGYADLVGQLPEVIKWLEQPVRWLLFCWVGLFAAQRMKSTAMLQALGLKAPAFRALLFALLACSPMLVGPLLLGRFSPEITWLGLLFSTGIWPLAEEILFRGYLFGQLHRQGGFGLWSAAILTGVIFGVLHLGQASVQQLPLTGEVGTVLLISVGGIFYAWLFVRWDFNLWVPFGMHMFMNLWWDVFDMAGNPLGGWVPNVLRTLTVCLAIVLTIYRHRLPVFASASKT